MVAGASKPPSVALSGSDQPHWSGPFLFSGGRVFLEILRGCRSPYAACPPVLFLTEGLSMPIEQLKRLQKHFDLCILRAPEHEESEWFRRWRNCLGHLIDFPGMSLSAAWDASDPARYKAHTAPL